MYHTAYVNKNNASGVALLGGINKATNYIKINFHCFVFMQIASHCTVRSSNEPGCVAWRGLRSVCHHIATFHNGSNLYSPVLALSAAGQNTQGIRAEYIPLSDTGSHSTVSFPFRLYALGNEGFFLLPLLWITYWNPAAEEWFKHSHVYFPFQLLRASSYFTPTQ